MNATTITTWLLTYLIHSTVFLGSAWLVSRVLDDRRLALQETLLRGALIGGLLTATCQVGLGLEPIGGAIAVDGLGQTKIIATSDDSQTEATPNQIAIKPPAVPSSPKRTLWPYALISLWAVGSLLALTTLGRSVLDLKRILKTRSFRSTDRLFDRLAMAMGLRQRVRLSTSAAIAIPFATGIRQPEICCPERVGELAREHRKSLFAHELAHLARRDPAWQLLYRIGEAMLFLQPLNRVVRTRLEEIAEHLTDERAAACTGDRLGLARCLVVVAHWGISSPPGVPATAFAAGPHLDRRVRHLISGAIGQHQRAPWTAPLLVALLVGSVLLLPAIMPSTVHADLSLTGSGAVPLDTRSIAAATSDAEAPPPPAPPVAPPVSDLPPPVAPVVEIAPAADTVPRSQAAPAPAAVRDTGALPAPAAAPEASEDTVPPTAPEPGSEPTPPTPPTAPEPPEQSDEKTAEPAPVASSSERQRERHRAPDTPTRSERERSREEQRERLRETSRERAEAVERARGERRVLHEERRVLAEQVRELAREAAEQGRLTEIERQKLRDEARGLREQVRIDGRELARASEERSREYAERSRELARAAAERARLTEEEREELRRQVEAVHAEARELAREAASEARENARRLSEEARRLAEEEEAKRRQEER